MKSFKAFTLVEVALILVLIGLFLGLGASLIGVLTKRIKYVESREEVRRAVEALKGYAIRFGYLPQARPETNYNPASLDPVFNILGIKGTDALGRALLYRVDGNLTHNFTDLCSLNGTSLYVIDNSTGTNQLKNNIVFVIVSGGLNYNLQTNLIVYFQGQPSVDDFSYDFLRPEEYDDIVEYVSLFELQTQRCNYASSGYCSSLRVNLDNNINSYRKSGGACASGSFVVLGQSDYLETYIGANCNNFCGNFNFSELIGYDTNKNCQIAIIKQSNNCVPNDN